MQTWNDVLMDVLFDQEAAGDDRPSNYSSLLALAEFTGEQLERADEYRQYIGESGVDY
ncbi:MAG: hypothetical protein KY475_23315 [Planctomycetes bacterium]|nr:hypothetical protein [Planctomycetota bacterium]